MILSDYETEDLLMELERRNFKVAIKIVSVEVQCKIGDKEYEVKAI
jgi:hypothetical protein